MIEFKHIGRQRMNDASRSGNGVYQALARDLQRRRLVLIQGTNPSLFNASSVLRGEILEKEHISRALINAHTRGRLTPNESDMYSSTPFSVQFVSSVEETSFSQHVYYDVYFITTR
jgi:hypothetical protein